MRIDAFRFRHVGPFGADGVQVENIQPGLNVIAEHNERGKSSLLAALETVLFLPHTSWKGDAKRLKRADGSPMGQIDFTHQGQRFRLDKQFLSGKMATLTDLGSGQVIARRREAEDQVADLLGLQREEKGPSGLLWVRQGDSMTAAEDDGQVASKLESELSTLVGGERARAYLERTEAELGELLTATGRVKTGGPLAMAEDALARVESELETARQAQRATRQLGQDLARVQSQIENLIAEHDPKADTKALEEAQDAYEKARSAKSEQDRLQAQLGRLAAELDQAQDRLTAHQSQIAAFDQAVADADRLQREVEALSEQRSEALSKLNAATEALTALDDQRERVAKIETHKAIGERLARNNADLQTVNENLEQLERDIKRKNSLIAERDALPPVTREDLSQLDQLERERDQIDAELRGIEARLLLTLNPGVKAKLGDTPVSSGPIRLDGTQSLEIEGVGSLSLDPAEVSDLKSRKAELEEQYSRQLSEIGVEDRNGAVSAARQREELSNDLTLLQRQMSIVAPHGHDALIDAQTRLTDEIAQLTSRIDLEADLDLSDLDSEAIARDLAQARGVQTAAQDRLGDIDRDLATKNEQLAFQTRFIKHADDRVRPAQRDAVSGQLAAATATLTEQVRQTEAALKAASSQIETDPDFLKARIQRLTDAARNRADTLGKLRTEEATLIARRQENFESRDPDAEVDRLEAQQDALQDEVDRHRRRAKALTLLRDTLREAQASLQERYTDPVKQELLPLLRRVIDDADIDLNEKLGAEGLVRSGQTEEIESLSGGTREQIAILTRLAFARMLSRQGHPSPVILDDALVYADDQRRQRMFEVMNYVTSGADPLQLIYLSCHERSTRELGGHVLTLKPWADPSAG